VTASRHRGLGSGAACSKEAVIKLYYGNRQRAAGIRDRRSTRSEESERAGAKSGKSLMRDLRVKQKRAELLFLVQAEAVLARSENLLGACMFGGGARLGLEQFTNAFHAVSQCVVGRAYRQETLPCIRGRSGCRNPALFFLDPAFNLIPSTLAAPLGCRLVRIQKSIRIPLKIAKSSMCFS
jgi:hypothetical protein